MKIETSINVLNRTGVNDQVDSSTVSRGDVKDFSNMLDEMFERLNGGMQKAEEMAGSLAAGKDVDIPEAMIAINKADISFRMFLQLRNKALNAYEEIMRLQF